MATDTVVVNINGKPYHVTGAAAEIVSLAVEAMSFLNSPRISGQFIIDFGRDGAKARTFVTPSNLAPPK